MKAELIASSTSGPHRTTPSAVGSGGGGVSVLKLLVRHEEKRRLLLVVHQLVRWHNKVDQLQWFLNLHLHWKPCGEFLELWKAWGREA